MKSTHIRDTSPTRDTCPTLRRTDRGTYLVQGYVVTDPEALAELNVPEGETVVEVPAELLPEIDDAREIAKVAPLR